MKPPPPLSPRENQIMLLVSDGVRDGEIADVLKISINTVDSHWRKIMMKMRASNRAQAVADFTLGKILSCQSNKTKK